MNAWDLLRRERRRRLVPLGISLLGGGLVWAMTSAHGPAVSPDSTSYLAAARSLVEGHGLRGFDGTPMVSWPPLLPLVLALIHTLGLEMVRGLRWFYLAFEAFAVGFSVWWLASMSTSSDGASPHRKRGAGFRDVRKPKAPATGKGAIPLWAILLVGIAGATSLPQLRVASTVWSELLFIALALPCLNAAVEASLGGHRRALVVAVATAALAALTRYSAAALIMAVALLFLFVGKRRFQGGTIGKRVIRSFLFALSASIPLALWMLRNWSLSGTLTGPRFPTGLHFLKTTGFLGASLPGLFLPHRITGVLPGHVWLLLFAALWGGMLWLTLRALKTEPSSRLLVTRLALLLYVGSFFLVLAAAFTTIGMDRPNDRLWAPLVLPSLILLGSFLRGRRGRPFWIATAMLAAAMVTGAVGLPARIHRFQTQESGFALPVWQRSPLVQHLRSHPPRGPILSDYPEALYYLCGIRAGWTPRMKNYGSHNILIQQKELKQFEDTVKGSRGVTIAWFEVGRSYLFPLKWLRKYYPITTITKLDDGEIAFVSTFEGSAVKGLKEKYRKKE